MTMRRARGMTLIELMTTIAIAAILTMIAVPSFTKIIALQRLKSASSNLQVALLTGRSEAIKRNSNVTVKSVTANADWSSGWQVADGTTSTVIANYPATSNLTITGPASGVTYQSSGRISATASTTFKVSSSSITEVRCVTITVMGVPAVTSSGC
ncbi:MAG TPA: GspH/FimT family pseudopilin [Ramlibacter sp.]|nr:GspH/FimT family pseudopilin [Ramlibacter sp.]